MSEPSQPNKLEVIYLTNLVLIKYHISDYKTAVMTIENGEATLDVRTYGPSLRQDYEVMGPITKPGQNLRPGQIWRVRLKDKKGITEVTITDLGYRKRAVVTLASRGKGRKWKAGYRIDDVDWIERM